MNSATGRWTSSKRKCDRSLNVVDHKKGINKENIEKKWKKKEFWREILKEEEIKLEKVWQIQM